MATDEKLEIDFGPFVHMVPEEKRIWLRWLAGEGATKGPYVYDIRVGEPLPLPEDATDLDKRIALALTRKRIDAAGLQPGLTTIYEVKEHAGLSTVGQIKGYQYLYQKDNPASPPINLVIITDKAQQDVVAYATTLGITVKELP